MVKTKKEKPTEAGSAMEDLLGDGPEDQLSVSKKLRDV